MSAVSRLLSRACLVLAALCASKSALALDMCVDSPDLLTSALALGQFQTQPFRIKIVQGTYTMTGNTEADFSAPTIIEGGYAPGCASRTADAGNTIIDIGQGRRLRLTQHEASPQAQLTLDGMTLRNTNLGIILQAGQYAYVGSSDGGSLVLRRVRVTKVASTENFALLLTADEERMTLENVQIDHVSAPESCPLRLQAHDHARIDVNHATIELASGDNLCLQDEEHATQMRIYNSIVWSSSGASLIAGAVEADTQVSIVNTLFQQHVLDGEVTVLNPINEPPRFVDAAGGNYRLSGDPLSPAINSAALVTPFGVPATDIENRPRIAGLMPDRGAYESSVSTQDTLTVVNTNDNGLGSLRQAMIEANATPNAKTIEFDIRNGAGTPLCPAVIALSTPLPKIVSPVTIDGRTQPTSVPNSSELAFNAKLCVVLKPAASTLSTAFSVAPTASEASLALYGFGMGGFGQPVTLLGGHDHIIAGNQFGAFVAGMPLAGASLNAIVIGAGAGGSVRIGGTVEERNVIGGADHAGIHIQGDVSTTSDRCVILNNLIGLSPSGTAPHANFVGINAAGGACLVRGNRIAGNTHANLWINGSDANVVQANSIGSTVQGVGVINQAVGILVSGAAGGNLIGSHTGSVADANTVSFMTKGGVVVQGEQAWGTEIRANRIDRNGYDGEGMDVDLQPEGAVAGPTANDAGDLDHGGNELQNFPLPTGFGYTQPPSAADTRSGYAHVVLNTWPGTYMVDAYFSTRANTGSGRGHMQTHVGRVSITVNQSGEVGFGVPVALPARTRGFLAFTATSPLGDTSEIGVAMVVNDRLFSDEFEAD